jgi:hypothetical protein
MRADMKRLFSSLLLAAVCALFQSTVLAQELLSAEMQQMQGASGFDRNMAVTSTMQLSDAENAKFWPVYMNYLDGLQDLNRQYAALIQNYIAALRGGAVSDDLATQLTSQFLTLQGQELQLRKTYSANLAKVLPGIAVARALQIENKIRAVAWFGLASQLPLARSNLSQ